jgi:alpha-L-glutamate ligase-like protein
MTESGSMNDSRPSKPRRWWHSPRRPTEVLHNADRFNKVLGMNARNAHIARDNPVAAVHLVNDKYATKQALAAVGAPAAPTLALIGSRMELRTFDWAGLPDSWALKPNQSLGGNGILLAFGRDPEAEGGTAWLSGSGRRITLAQITDHVRFILDGEFSGRARDMALFEPLIRAHPDMERLSFQGLPDIRVLCLTNAPVLAMTRLPTSASGGRANLHQGAIGAAVDLESGRVTGAWMGRRSLTHHPDTGAELVGAVLPHWPQVLEAASRCGPATGLRYVGADVVIDRDDGPLILEVNARPGLQIQNVTGRGLLGVMEPGGRG